MKALHTIWKPLSIFYYLGIYIYLIIVQEQPVHSLIVPYLLFITLTGLIFIGNILGFIGLLIHIATRNDRKPRPFYRLAFKLGSNQINILATYALMLLKDGAIKEAEAIYNYLLTFKKLTPSLQKIMLANLAICDWKLGDIPKAISSYEAILNHTLYQSYLTADDYTTLGYLYLEENQWDKAFDFTNKALELDDTHPSALDNLGQYYYRQGNIEKAIFYLEKALEIKNTLVDSNFLLGQIYENQHDYKKAISYYEAALNGNISALNTVDKKTIEEKYQGVKKHLQHII